MDVDDLVVIVLVVVVRKIFGRGEMDRELREYAWFAVDFDTGPVRLDNAVADAEAQAHPFPDLALCEEWIENLFAVFGRDATTVVADRDPDQLLDRGRSSALDKKRAKGGPRSSRSGRLRLRR